jgi:hypothetical protein
MLGTTTIQALSVRKHTCSVRNHSFREGRPDGLQRNSRGYVGAFDHADAFAKGGVTDASVQRFH